MKKLILTTVMVLLSCSTAFARTDIIIAPVIPMPVVPVDQCSYEYNQIVQQEQSNIQWCNMNVYGPQNYACQQDAIANANQQLNNIAGCREFYTNNNLLIVIGPGRHYHPHRVYEPHRHHDGDRYHYEHR